MDFVLSSSQLTSACSLGHWTTCPSPCPMCSCIQIDGEASTATVNGFSGCVECSVISDDRALAVDRLWQVVDEHQKKAPDQVHCNGVSQTLGSAMTMFHHSICHTALHLQRGLNAAWRKTCAFYILCAQTQTQTKTQRHLFKQDYRKSKWLLV